MQPCDRKFGSESPLLIGGSNSLRVLLRLIQLSSDQNHSCVDDFSLAKGEHVGKCRV